MVLVMKERNTYTNGLFDLLLPLFFSDILSNEQKQREFDDNDSRDFALLRGARCGLILLRPLALVCLLIITALWFISPYYFLDRPNANVTDSTNFQSEFLYHFLLPWSQILAGFILILIAVLLFFLSCCNTDSFSPRFRLIFYPFFTKLPIAPMKSAIVEESDTNLNSEVDSKR